MQKSADGLPCRLCLRDFEVGVDCRLLFTRGILARRVDDGPPVRVEYSLTRKGRAFQHLARSIERWGRELASER